MLEIKQLSYAYDEYVNVLNNVQLTVNPGDFLAVVGFEGEGKTTLIKLINGTLKKQTGTITLNGKDNAQFLVKNEMLTLLKEDVLPGFLTGQEYIHLQLVLHRKRLKEAYLKDLSVYFDCEALLHVKIRNYPDEMKKKIQLIAALLVEPKVLLIDEVFSDVTTDLKIKVLKQLKSFSEKGCMMIICCRDLNMLEKVCTRAGILHDGTLHFGEQAHQKRISET